MKKIILYVFVGFCVLLISRPAEAKVWRVNNTAGISADFKEITTAIASNLVLAGDTLYIEGTAVAYTPTTLNKKLTLIGAGYLLSGTGANTGLQAMGLSSRIGTMYLDSLGSGSTFIGLSGTFFCYSSTDDITFTRCEISMQVYSTLANTKMANYVINKCFGVISLPGMQLENCRITNCIFTGGVDISRAVNGLIRNNVFASTASISNSYICNNIFLGTVTSLSSTVKYNIASGASTLPAGNNNQNGILATAIFESTGSADGKYMLKSGSPAIGAGEPINGITPDIGAFGTADPYRLSGIPAIPTIYSLTVPTSVPSSATSMNITFSTRSNN